MRLELQHWETFTMSYVNESRKIPPENRIHIGLNYGEPNATSTCAYIGITNKGHTF